jgi:hypothetical protein
MPIEIKVVIDFPALADLVTLLVTQSSQQKQVDALTKDVADLTALLNKSSSALKTAEQPQAHS